MAHTPHKDTLTEQTFNQDAVLGAEQVLARAPDKLAPTRLALRMLFAVAKVAILLVSR